MTNQATHIRAEVARLLCPPHINRSPELVLRAALPVDEMRKESQWAPIRYLESHVSLVWNPWTWRSYMAATAEHDAKIRMLLASGILITCEGPYGFRLIFFKKEIS